MNKYIKVVLSIIIILFSTLNFCSCDTNEEFQGGFESINYKIPKGITNVYNISIINNKEIILVGCDNEDKLYCYKSTDNGASFSKKYDVPDILCNDDYLISKVFIKNDGSLLLLINTSNENTNNYEFYNINSKESSKLNIDEKYLMNLSNVNINTEGNIYIYSNNDKKFYSINGKNGKLIDEVNIEKEVNNFAVNKKYIVYSSTSKLFLYNLKNRKTKDLSRIKNSNNYIYLFNDFNNKNEFDFLDGEKLYKYNSKNKIKSYFENDRNVISYVKISDKEFLLVEENKGEISLVHYLYRKTYKNKTQKKQIKIYSLYKDGNISDLVNLYNSSNKKVNLEYEYGITDKSITQNDAVKTLNTELAAGKGPDIIILDDLDTDTYLKKNLFENIYDAVNKHKNELFNNVYNEYCNKNTKIYTFPIAMEIPVVVSSENSSKVTDLNSLSDSIKQDSLQNKKNLMNVVEPKELVNSLYYGCVDSWISNDNTIDDNKLKEFLTDSKTIFDCSYNSLTDDVKGIHNKNISEAKENNTEEDWYHNYLLNNRCLQDIVINKSIYNVGYLMSVNDVTSLEGAKHVCSNLNYSLWKGQGSEYFTSEYLMAVNKNCKMKDKAKDIVSYMLSKETQEKLSLPGISTNKEVVRYDINKQNSLINGEGSSIDVELYDSSNNAISFQNKSLDETESKMFLDEIEKTKIGVSDNSVLLNSADDDIEKYISGDESLEVAASNIENKLNIYLSELSN